MQENRTCDSMEHYEHLCSLKMNCCDQERLAQMEIDPMYECKTCGSKTREAKNLCTPNLIGT